jgi:hypothetical protein
LNHLRPAYRATAQMFHWWRMLKATLPAQLEL